MFVLVRSLCLSSLCRFSSNRNANKNKIFVKECENNNNGQIIHSYNESSTINNHPELRLKKAIEKCFFYIFLQNRSRKITTKSKRKRRRKKWIEMKWSEVNVEAKGKIYTLTRTNERRNITKTATVSVRAREKSKKSK